MKETSWFVTHMYDDPWCLWCVFVLTKIHLKMTIFWDVTMYSLIGIDWCFIGAYYLHHRGDELPPQDVQIVTTLLNRFFCIQYVRCAICCFAAMLPWQFVALVTTLDSPCRYNWLLLYTVIIAFIPWCCFFATVIFCGCVE
jgi:hypothetical protein